MRYLILSLLLTLLAMRPTTAQNDLPPLERSLSGIVTIGVFKVAPGDRAMGFADAEPKKSYAEIAYRENLNMGDVFSNGSGFVIQLDGESYIVTNAHVIDAASTENGSVFAFSVDRTKYAVEIIGGDSFYDIAVLRFSEQEPGPEILPLEFSDQEAQLAQRIYAIGNPLGNYPYSITEGIISGKNRLYHRPTTGRFGFLQHTATLIWGNSGGPLVNEKGKVVGVNTWIETRNKNGQNYLFSQLNFALEGRRAESLVRNIVSNDGRLRRAFLGVEFATMAPFNQPDGPPYIKSVLESSPAYESLQDKTGFTVTAINDEKVQTLQDIVRIMENTAPGDPVRLKLKKAISSPEVEIPAAELTTEQLKQIATYFFQTYMNYLPDENDKGVSLKSTKNTVRLQRFKAAGQGDGWAEFEPIQGKPQYGLAGLGGMSKQGTLGAYQAGTLENLGAIIRLCSLEGNLGATLVEAENDEYAGTFLIPMQDDDFNELKVLFY